MSLPFMPVFRLNMRYREVIREIRKIDGELSRMVLSDADYSTLVVGTYSTNVHWSVKVEGNSLPIQEVRRLSMLFSRGDVDEPLDSNKREIFNHMYSYFAKDEFSLPWNVGTIKELHRRLMENVDRKEQLGEFRDEPTSFVGKDGQDYYIACPPAKIDEEMDSLMEWLRSSPYDELITSIVFLEAFESIHPFKVGNGRVGRTLFQMLLHEMGLRNSKLCRIDEELLSDDGTYYSLLIYTEATRDYCPLIMFVAESLLRSYRKAFEMFSEKDLVPRMDGYMLEIVRNAKAVDNFTVMDASNWLTGISEQSVRLKLKALTEMDVLEKTGQTRSQRYSFKDPFRRLRKELTGQSR